MLRHWGRAHAPSGAPETTATVHNTSAQWRRCAFANKVTKVPAPTLFKALQWGLILFCLVFGFVGGTVAERVMDLLQCQPHADPTLRTCSWLTNPLALRLAPFLSANSPADYAFTLLSNFWGLIALWLLAIGAARWAEINPAQASAWWQRWSPRPLATSLHSTDVLRWSVRAAFWLLLLGLIAFCVALGAPIVGTDTARSILHSLGCSPGTFDPFSSPCMKATGFWTPRLAFYVLPLAGPLLAPVWLIMGFWDVLIAWAALIAAAHFLHASLSSRAPPRPQPD